MADPPERIDIPSATDDPAAYVKALLTVAGDNETFGVIARTSVHARSLCADLTQELADTAPEPGEWPTSLIIGHLFDVDIVYGFRWRQVVTEDDPIYPGYDQERWSPLPRLPFWQMLDAWEGLRAANVALLRALPSEAWGRTGRHGEQGGETMEVMVRKVVGHDIAHLNQVYRTARTVLLEAGESVERLETAYRDFRATITVD